MNERDPQSPPRRPASPDTPGRTWLRFTVRAVVGFFSVILAFVLAASVFNFIVMPYVVRQGHVVSVPKVSGMTLPEAAQALTGAGLAVRDTVLRVSPSVPIGVVMDQDPPAGRSVKPERQVLLVVSQGGRERRVPPVDAQTLRFARIALGQEGYVVGDVVRVPSTRLPENMVLTSDPPESTRLDPGRAVSLLVSSGPDTRTAAWILPDFRGERLSRIEDDLRIAGFDVVVDFEGIPGRFGGLPEVVRTEPEPGSLVRRGERIHLVAG